MRTLGTTMGQYGGSTPIAMYYFTFGSIDASGDSIFNRQFDEIEVWDGMPPNISPPSNVKIIQIR